MCVGGKVEGGEGVLVEVEMNERWQRLEAVDFGDLVAAQI